MKLSIWAPQPPIRSTGIWVQSRTAAATTNGCLHPPSLVGTGPPPWTTPPPHPPPTMITIRSTTSTPRNEIGWSALSTRYFQTPQITWTIITVVTIPSTITSTIFTSSSSNTAWWKEVVVKARWKTITTTTKAAAGRKIKATTGAVVTRWGWVTNF